MRAAADNDETAALVLGAVDAIDDGLAVIDRGHDFVWVNMWLEQRYSALGPLVGSKCFRLIASSEGPCDGCPLTSEEGEGTRGIHEMPCPAAHDGPAWIEVQGAPLKDADGRVVGAVAHFHDVTGRKAAEDALREEASRRRTLFEQSHDGIVVLTRDGAVYEANEEYARQLGYTLDEVYQLRIWDWQKDKTPDELLELLRWDDRQGRDFMARHMRKDGTFYDVDIHSNSAVIGDAVYIQCICRDMSEQKQAERERQAADDALREEVARRRLLVEQSRDGIVVLDEAGHVAESNLEFTRMLGYTPEEMLALHVWDWEYLYSREQVVSMLNTVDASGDHFITKHRRKDGSTYEVEISTNGGVYGGKRLVFCVCRDISEKQQADREREALIAELQDALAELKVLRGIIPVCSFCKKVRDDRGYWEQVEVYIKKNSEADVSHGICPDCLRLHFPEMKQ